MPEDMVLDPKARKAYLATREGKVVCLDPYTGDSLWEADPLGKDHRGATLLAVQDKRLVALCKDNRPPTMAAMSTDDGRILWRRDTMPRVGLLGGATRFPEGIAIAGDLALVPAVQGRNKFETTTGLLAVFDLESGRLRRKIRLSDPSETVCSDGTRAWVVGHRLADKWERTITSEIICVDLASGRELWKSAGLKAFIRPVLANGVILVLCDGGIVRGLSARDGSRLWEVRVGGKEGWEPRALLVVGNRIVAWGSAHAAVLATPD